MVNKCPSRSAILTGNFSHVNGFYKNVNGGDFNGEQMTFPKIFQKTDIKQRLLENGTWEQHLSTGFDYSKVLVNWGGQGTYFNPQFPVSMEKDT